MRRINKLIVHCSATREGLPVSLKTITTWHVEGNKWDDVGYHYIVHLDGKISKGRRDSILGAHTKGQNTDSLGICYVGGMDEDNYQPKDTRTCAQKESLAALLLTLKHLYNDSVVHGHRDFSNKACPSFDATEEYKWISSYDYEENC
jgi:N-acetylmuramoyl-L-alanine amidase|tara:strand:+ start:874 stop:1314 length:441 start_codon:yes stop_codon:yes gene_type:complete